MPIRLEVYFSQKYQLVCNYYHSDGFYLISYVSNKPDNHFAVNFSCHFIFSYLFFFFLISENQSAAGNVIQLIKKHQPNLILILGHKYVP